MNAPVKNKNSMTPLPMQRETNGTARSLDELIPGCIDSIGLVTGIANTIMQLSHPAVGHGVVESRVQSGSILHHPFKRTRTTLTYLAVAMQGSTEEKRAYRKAVNGAHAQVHSTAQSPVKYNAFDPELQLWVAACLYWGFADNYEKFRGPFTPEEAALFYKLAEPLGTTLQVRADMWPADVEAFNVYWEQKLDEIAIDDTVRTFLTRLVNLRFLSPVVSIPLGPSSRFLTTGFLPPKLRQEMHLDWSPVQQRRFNKLIGGMGTINRKLPRLIRQLPLNVMLWDFRRRLRKGLPLI